MKMTEFRSQQPLNDDDFKTIRRNVMAAIEARRERRFFPMVMRFALAAAAIVAIVFALIPHRQTTPATIAIKSTPPPVIVPKAAVVSAPAAIAQAIPPVTHRVRRHHPPPHIELASQNIRVEFRTSDPDIRIIWIANQTPNTTSGGKS